MLAASPVLLLRSQSSEIACGWPWNWTVLGKMAPPSQGIKMVQRVTHEILFDNASTNL